MKQKQLTQKSPVGALILILLLPLLFVSCEKKPPEIIPSPSFTLKSDTALFNASGTIIVSNVSNVTEFSVDKGGKIEGLSYVTSNLISATSYEITGKGPGGSTTRSIVVPVFTQKTTQLHLLPGVHMVLNQSYPVGYQNDLTKWINWPVSNCDILKFDARGSWFVTYGSCSPNSGVKTTPVPWKWGDTTETSIDLGSTGMYLFTFLSDGSGFILSQTANGNVVVLTYKY